MAVTSTQAVNMLVALLKTSPLLTSEQKAKGGIYPYQRPLGSRSEDIVVNSPTLGREAVQRGLLNVNVFVSNKSLPVNTDGIQRMDDTRPDVPRLTELAALGSTFLNDHWSEDGTVNFELQEEVLLSDPNNKQHFINFRVIFRALNIQ